MISITVASKTLCWVIHDEVAGLYSDKHTHIQTHICTYAHTHAHAYIYTPYLLAQAALNRYAVQEDLDLRLQSWGLQLWSSLAHLDGMTLLFFLSLSHFPKQLSQESLVCIIPKYLLVWHSVYCVWMCVFNHCGGRMASI